MTIKRDVDGVTLTFDPSSESWTGPLDSLAEVIGNRSHVVLSVASDERKYVARALDGDPSQPPNMDNEAEFGIGETPERALEFLIGAYFGPPEDE